MSDPQYYGPDIFQGIMLKITYDNKQLFSLFHTNFHLKKRIFSGGQKVIFASPTIISVDTNPI